MVVYNINSDFPFESMLLGSPSAIQGGSYSAPITSNGLPVYVQLPKCTTKSGIVETKRTNYCDLLYSSDASNLASWIEGLENRCCKLIDSKKHLWFTNELSTADVEGMITPIARPHKQGAALLLRIQLDTNRGNDKLKCKVFNDDETQAEASQVDKDTSLIPLIHIEAIRFTSRSFDVVLKMEQLMIIKPESLPKGCMIKTSKEQKALAVIPSNVLKRIEISTEKLEDEFVNNIERIGANKGENKGEAELNIEENTSSIEETNSESISEYDDEEIDDSGSEKDDLLEINENDEIKLDCIELLEKPEKVEGIREIEINCGENDDNPMILKRPNEVYYEIYKAAIEKAKHMRKVAVEAYLEAKQIKSKYLLEDIDDSDGEAELKGSAGL